MSLRVARRSYAWILFLVCGLAPLLAAPPKQVTSKQGVVDIVVLKSGRSLRGGITWREPNGSLSMLISRQWLKTSNPMMVPAALAESRDRSIAASTQTRDRIAERLKKASDPPQLTFFLKQEAERLNQFLAKPTLDEPEFLWFDIASETISKVTMATPEQRRIALHAWNEGLPQIETRDASSLLTELKAKGVKNEGSSPDISDRLPARLQDESEWAARMALVEYTLIKPLDFQGMGDNLARTGDGQALNLSELLPKLLQTQLNSLLKDLTSDGQATSKTQAATEWLKPAIQEAEKEKRRGFHVTRVEVDAVLLRATVETRFVAQISSGPWKTVWCHSVVEDGTKPRPQAEARIEQDPQLKSATETLKSLGLGDTKTLQQAIRFGAATMAAQESADAEFGEFRERYSRHLDRPPLRISDEQ